MTSIIAVLTVMAVFQLAFALHVRNSLTAFAVEGARHAARADAPPEAGVERTRYLAERSAASRPLQRVEQSRSTLAGREVVVVEATAALPILGPWGIGDSLVVRGRALQEGTS